MLRGKDVLKLQGNSSVLKQLQNYNRNYFCVRHKNRRKHNKHVKYAIFQTKYRHIEKKKAHKPALREREETKRNRSKNGMELLFRNYYGIVSSGNVCYLAHFFIGSKQIQKNLYYETFFSLFLTYY